MEDKNNIQEENIAKPLRYALNLNEDGRILSITEERYAWEGMPIVDSFPEGNTYEYRYIDGEYIHDPLPEEEPSYEPTEEEDIAALVIDHEYRLTLLELGVY